MIGDSKPPVSRAVPGTPGEVSQPARLRREIDSAELFAGSREVFIRHAGEIYTLRQTSRGKLILTK
jgi:hemin uptake protein HemP